MHRYQTCVYKWNYIKQAARGRALRSRIKFMAAAVRGSHSVDWVRGVAWCSPIVPLGPPQMRHGV